MKAFTIAMILSALALTGCATATETYTGGDRSKPCAEQYVEKATIDRCEYDTSYNTN